MKYLSVAAFWLLFWGGMLMLPNLLGILRYAFFKKKYSMIPFLGGVLTSIGLLLLPRLRPFAWIPLIVDPGCALLGAKLLFNWRTIFRNGPDAGSAGRN
jgi:hypothetical protein